jgi:hypothetical protein
MDKADCMQVSQAGKGNASALSSAHNFRKALSESVQYLYFLRFPIIFWLSLPIFAAVDAHSGLNALTRGIFTPPVYYAFGAAEFFVICLGMVSLLTARIVCINGQSRFGTIPPNWIRKSLGKDSEDWVWRTLIISQLPGVYVIYRYHWNAHIEHAVLNSHGPILIEVLWSAVGILSAVAFWSFINAIYYWASCLQPHPGPAPTLLWPRHNRMTPRTLHESDVPFAIKPLLWIFRSIAALGPGYADSNNILFEGHQLATVGALLYWVLYIVLAPITAPTQQRLYTLIVLLVLGAATAIVAWSISRVPSDQNDKKLQKQLIFSFLCVAFIALAAACAAFFSSFFATWIWFEHFPVIAAVAVLLTSLAFMFSGIAFWADRHRIPVLTLSIVVISLLQFIRPRGEHFFNPIARRQIAHAVLPADAFKNYEHIVCHDEQPCPLIIVTASGGGIHAAAWTSVVLTELEKQFAKDQPGFTFHDHLLLLSTVSGGSVGAMPFLREYYASKPFDNSVVPLCDSNTDPKNCASDPTWIGQVRRAAFCSSLGGVGWGLEYGDLLRLLGPELPYVNRITDRSQALEETLQRNLTARSCNPAYGDDRFGDPDSLQQLTLGQMMEDLGGSSQRAIRIPAFSFNSTVAETGGRFLFSNYENGSFGYAAFGVPPAQSWLSDYADGHHLNLDLNLVTAARLSATFPYVSSAARVRGDINISPVQHFIDGGYFDNDGTSTAIEFLEQIFPPSIPESEREDGSARPVTVTPILFIEIRDGSDLMPTASDEQLVWGGCPDQERTWTPSSQLSAPLKGFWNAGHSSITRRNRRELEMLMDDLQNRGVARFRHLVFDYQLAVPANASENPRTDPHRCSHPNEALTDHQAAQPLSWHLTANQEDDIRNSFVQVSECSMHATDWARNYKNEQTNIHWPRSPEVECDEAMSKSEISKNTPGLTQP